MRAQLSDQLVIDSPTTGATGCDDEIVDSTLRMAHPLRRALVDTRGDSRVPSPDMHIRRLGQRPGSTHELSGPGAAEAGAISGAPRWRWYPTLATSADV
jgi:hypothetical protein